VSTETSNSVRRFSPRSLLRWLPGVVLTFVAFVFLVYAVDWAKFAQVIITFPLGVLAISVLIYLVSMAMRGLCWNALLQHKVPPLTTILVMNEGYFLNNVLPARMGEIGRSWIMGRRSGLGVFRVLSTVLVERAYDVAFAAALLLSVLPLVLNIEQARPLAMILFILVIGGLFALYLAARNRDRLEGLLNLWLGRSQRAQRWVLPQIHSLLDGFSVLAQPKYFFLSLFFAASTWGLALLRDWLLISTLVPGAPFWWAVLAISGVNLAGALPSTMASIGVFEGAAVAVLALVGVPSELALAYALIVHITHLISSSAIGAYGLSQEGKSLTELYDEIRSVNRA
jgi:glycosyltransferase 2 family protein